MSNSLNCNTSYNTDLNTTWVAQPGHVTVEFIARTCIGVTRQSASCRPRGGRGLGCKITHFYSISGAMGTQNLAEFYLTLFLSNHVCYNEEYTRSKRSHFQKYGIHMTIIMSQWSNKKTQLPNDQIRSTWCIATRGNVSKVCILTVYSWNDLELQRTF